nr:MAG TPA: repressor protein CI [Caudoviricetes sp.]
MNDLQRIKKVVKWLIFSDYGESEKEIAELLGYKKSSFSQLMNGKVPLSDKFIEKLLSIDSNINKVWILTGEGSMFKKKEVKEVSQQDPPAANNELVELLREKAAILEGQIKDKEEKEAMYKEKIMALENELRVYKSLSQPSRAVASDNAKYSTARV